ncbi:glutathione S-transferase [Mesorhizobium japonicum]|uniref:Glutathione S-transferase n=1 Tax=Mesorhizobium japonicum (strain LMG 29417 / CECT 9101 / MAFF 303099) TaxID=266835 RepID=Q987G8_RHILO|nr:glutathione S-transferase [Mesorhizobium japonicum]BAB53235.1 glutathione S-transferase [Mesorhizobium japonicum MAFF 303099]
MKLCHSTSSPNSRRVRMFIAEKGISTPLHPVNLGEKEQFSDWFKAVNPRQQVPVLVLDDDTKIAEVPAIWRYLEETHPERPWLGSDARSKALVAMWERRVELDGFAPTMEGVRNAVAGLKGRALSGPHDYEQIPELVERSKRRVANFYTDFDARLKESPFASGAEFSAADITALVTVDFATAGLKMPIPDQAHALQHWYEKVADRPSAKA